ncbi:hypothetical protein, partial [Brevundimonas aveniformis]|uniref:hypothetical protein n=1 Tax=Brevundimonas aveniformis TaxID=370977 RepID=UPI003CD0CB89
MIRAWKPLTTLAVLALLAACGGPRYSPAPTGPAQTTQPPAPARGTSLIDQRVDDRTMDLIGEIGGSYDRCFAALAAAQVEFSPMPDRDDGTGCAYVD